MWICTRVNPHIFGKMPLKELAKITSISGIKGIGLSNLHPVNKWPVHNIFSQIAVIITIIPSTNTFSQK
jgi:hypothetical protein